MGYPYPYGLDIVHPYTCGSDEGQPSSNPKCGLGGSDMDLRIGLASLGPSMSLVRPTSLRENSWSFLLELQRANSTAGSRPARSDRIDEEVSDCRSWPRVDFTVNLAPTQNRLGLILISKIL
jgi:hypothetical protein